MIKYICKEITVWYDGPVAGNCIKVGDEEGKMYHFLAKNDEWDFLIYEYSEEYSKAESEIDSSVSYYENSTPIETIKSDEIEFNWKESIK